MKKRAILFFALIAAHAFDLAWAAAAPREPIVIESTSYRLGFDAETGAWTSLIDRASGDELIAQPAPRSLVLPVANPRLDRDKVVKLVAAKRAIDLTAGSWLYTPKPPKAEDASGIVQGHFDAVKWAETLVPSRRGAGDDRLHERIGDFYYRQEFRLPADWPDEDLMLVIGAVDDTDVTYLNGAWIGATGTETPHNWEAPRFYRVPKGLVRRDQPNVLLIKCMNGGFDGGIDAPIVLGLASDLAPTPTTGAPLKAHKRSRAGEATILTMATVHGPFEMTLKYVVLRDNSFLRQWTVKNVSNKEAILEHQPAYVIPPLNLGPKQAVIFPGSFPVGDQPVASLHDGEAISPRGLDPLVVVYDESKKRGLGAWFYSEAEFSPVTARRTGDAVELRHTQQIIMRLAPGESVTLGTQTIWFEHTTRQGVISWAPVHYPEALGPFGPVRRDLDRAVLYCGHPGGTPEKGFRGYGGFTALEKYALTLEKMHIDLIWLLPIWEHGDGRRWNLYSPFDHFQISPIYGTADELKSLSQALRERNIGLMFDLVPHGPPDFTPLAKEHPEWIALDRDGKRHYAWGQYAFDNAHPGWQDYFRKVAEWDAREFGAVGARVDCGAGGAPNWNKDVTNRPSLSTLAGGLGMNRAIREGFKKGLQTIGKATVVIPEEYTGANIFCGVSDLTYDAQLYYLYMDLQARNAPAEEWAERLQRFLADQKASLPIGALKMRWLSNHDTVSWTFQKHRPLDLYGRDKMLALQAINAYIEGVPMLYQGDEDPAIYGVEGPSSVDALAHIYDVRKKLEPFREAVVDYDAVHASGGVFACTWEGKRKTIVLISLNDQPVTSHLTAGSDQIMVEGEWRDIFADEPVKISSERSVAMKPFQVRVLMDREK